MEIKLDDPVICDTLAQMTNTEPFQAGTQMFLVGYVQVVDEVTVDGETYPFYFVSSGKNQTVGGTWMRGACVRKV